MIRVIGLQDSRFGSRISAVGLSLLKFRLQTTSDPKLKT